MNILASRRLTAANLVAVVTVGALVTVLLGAAPAHAADPYVGGSVSLDSSSYPVPFGGMYSEDGGVSQFPLHPASWAGLPPDSEDRSLAERKVVVRVMIIDDDYNLTVSRNDLIREDVRDLDGNGTPDAGPVKISIVRGSDEFLVGYAGGTESGTVDGTSHFGELREDENSAFVTDIELGYGMGPQSDRCPGPETENNCILRGNMLQVEYLDRVGAAPGNHRTVSDEAIFVLFDGVIQTDKNVYDAGDDAIFTLIDPDFDLDRERPDLLSLDLIGWRSNQTTTTLSDPALDAEPFILREAGQSIGIFQTIITIPYEINGHPLEGGEVVLEYVDWGPSTADYVGQTSNVTSITIQVNASQLPPQPLDARSVGIVTLNSTTRGIVHASWGAPAEEPVSYEVSWQRMTGGPYTAVSTFTTLPHYTFSGLAAEAEYAVTVRAQYDDASGEWSDKSLVTVSNFHSVVPEVSLDRRVYTWTDRVYITVISPNDNLDDTQIDEIGDIDDYPVTISTRNHKIDRYKLVETGTSTGIFTGHVTLTGFGHDADGDGTLDTASSGGSGSGPTDGLLESSDDDGIEVTFNYPEAEAVISSATIRWNIGEIQWLEANHSGNGTGIIRVIDRDMNLDPDVTDDFEVVVRSDIYTDGIGLTVTETALTTGVFEGTVSFSLDGDTSSNSLAVSDGDTVIAEYVDHTLPSPYVRNDSMDLHATLHIDVPAPSPNVPETIPETEPETIPETEPETIPETVPKIEPTPETVPKIEPTPETVPKIEPTPETVPKVETTPETVPKVETTPETVPKVETTPEPEPAPEPEPEPTPEPEPEPEPEEMPTPACGAGTELVNGICQVILSDVESEERSTEDGQEDFNFIAWLFSLFGWS